MAIFGARGDQLIKPSLQFYNGTVLASQSHKVSAAAMAGMTLGLGDSMVPGGEFNGAVPYNCPFGRDNPDSVKCRMTAKFTEAVDTLVIMYAAAQKIPV